MPNSLKKRTYSIQKKLKSGKTEHIFVFVWLQSVLSPTIMFIMKLNRTDVPVCKNSIPKVSIFRGFQHIKPEIQNKEGD